MHILEQRARQTIEEANRDHCGCCTNEKAKAIALGTMVQLLRQAKLAVEAAKALDMDVVGAYRWDGDDNVVEQLGDLIHDTEKSLAKYKSVGDSS